MTISDEQLKPHDLDRALSGRRFDRRGLLARAGALGLSTGMLGALSPALVRAQDASPEAATASGEVIKSMTRDEYYGKLHEAFAFEEPQNQGGQVIFTVPRSTLASSTVATRRPMSSTIWRAFAIRSPFERAISPSGR